MKIRYKIEVRNGEEHPFNVQIWEFDEDLKMWFYCGFGRFCKNAKEVKDFIIKDRKED
jgi:hypothetical protein